MTQPSENILVVNGIVRSEESNELYCALCTHVHANELQKHIQTPSHVRRLEKFNSIYDNLKTSLRCKICGINLNWKVLERHAIEHEIAPWYKPEDRYKIFFENQTLQWHNRFYCYPCDKVFLDWSSAFDHMDEKRHKKLLNAQEPDDKTLAYSGSSKTYKTLVNGGFIPWKNKSVVCKICDFFYIDIQSIDQHINESRHRDLRLKLIEGLKDRVDRETVAKQMSDNDITLTKGNNYWCKFCKSALTGLEQVLLHIKEDRHMDSRWGLTANGEETKFLDEPIRKEIRKEPVDAATSDRGSLLPEYIVEDSDTDFHCEICNLLIDGRGNIESHVWGEWHLKRRDKFHDNKISFEGDNNWHCDCCNYEIYSLDQVFAHMDDKTHKSSRMNLTANGIDSKIKNEPIKNEAIKQQVDGRGSLIPDYIVENSDTGFHCTICNLMIDNLNNVEGHVSGKRHSTRRDKFNDNEISFKGNNNWHCGSCNYEIYSLVKVFAHMDDKTHKSSRMNLTANGVDSKIKNEPIKNEAIKQQVDGPSDRGSLIPDYIVENSDTDFHCTICNYKGQNRDSVKDHIKGKRHSTRRDKFNDNEISFRGNNNWHCGSCNYEIYSLDRVFAHMDDKTHKSSRMDLAANGVDSKIKNELIKNETKQQPVDGTSDRGPLPPDYIVQDSDTEFYCIICDCTIINRVNIEGHVSGKPHANVRKNLDDNKITFHDENNYYCGFCNCKIPGFDNISVHIDGYRHASSRKNLTANGAHAKINLSNEPIKNEATKQLVNGTSDRGSSPPDYIVQDSAKEFYCTICDCTIINRVNIEGHVSGKPHASARKNLDDNKITFHDENNYHCGLCNCKISGFSSVSMHIDGNRHRIAMSRKQELPRDKILKDAGTTTRKLPYRYIVESNETHAFCKICDCQIGGYVNVEEHVRGHRHAGALKIFNENKIVFKKDDFYHCGYCNCKYSSYLAVQGHIKGLKHNRALDETKKPEVPKPEDPKPKEPSGQNLSRDYLMKINYTDSLCRICNCAVNSGLRNVNEHVAGSAHARALKKYGCDNISLVVPATKDYYCRSCDCRVPGMENLWRHTLGERHAASTNLENDQVTGEKKIPDDPKTLKGPNKVSKGLMKFKKFPCTGRLGPVNNSRRSFVSKIWKQQIRDLEVPVCCNICGVKLANVVEFHSHLAGHFSKDFVRSSKEEGRNIEDNNEVENRRLARALNLSTESIYTLASDGENCDSSETPGLRVNKEDGEPGRLERTPKKPNMERILRALNFENDEIYSMKDKLRELELGMKLSHSSFGQRTIYCLVCQLMTENTVENYFEHLCSLDHCVLLEKMEMDHAMFEKFPEQFSAIDLGLQCMEAITGDLVHCRACDEEINDDDEALRDHIDGSSHAQACRMIRNVQMRSLDLVKLPMHCDWYKVQIYRCVPCLLTFRSEANFVMHLASKGHLQSMERPVNTKRRLILDFCEACALLWYGYRRTCAYHRNIETHVWLIRDGHYIAAELPRQARDLLAMPERYINETIERYDGESASERDKERTLIRDLESSVRWKYDRAKAYVFGSRVTGVGSSCSDIDVFLDCGDRYNGKTSSRDGILKFMDGVFECLNQDSHSWAIEELLKTCRSPIIKVHHRPTGLSCDISFENGLAVENTRLIRSFNDVSPLCRGMIIFLKRWMTLCKLSGSERITSYAVYWHVIFYLQRESILPSVAKLIAMKNESHKIAGWEVGVARDFTCNEARINFRIRELLAGFFTFWSNFDHRYDVACPIIGKILKKRTFVNPSDLPKDMKPYVDYMRKPSSREPFRIDSAMCIQDPFDLQHNITKAVSKVYVNRFRKYCSISSDILNS